MTITKMLATAHQAASLDCDDIHGESSSLPSATTTWDAVRCLRILDLYQRGTSPRSFQNRLLLVQILPETNIGFQSRSTTYLKETPSNPENTWTKTSLVNHSTEIDYLAGLIYQWYHYYRKVEGEKIIPSQLIM